jgi:hypothetical protein
MKKASLLLFCALILGTAQAQERVINRGIINHNDDGTSRDRTNSGFGVKGGVLFSSLQGDSKSDIQGLKTGANWHAGFYSQFSVSPVFSIQPEALYGRREVKADDGDRRFDYIDVPVLAVVNVTDNISLHAGPQVGVMLTAKRDDKEIDKAEFNTFDYGVAGGVEAKVSMFRVGGRYYRSFADIGDFKSAANAADRAYNDLKAGNFQIYLGVGF